MIIIIWKYDDHHYMIHVNHHMTKRWATPVCLIFIILRLDWSKWRPFQLLTLNLRSHETSRYVYVILMYLLITVVHWYACWYKKLKIIQGPFFHFAVSWIHFIKSQGKLKTPSLKILQNTSSSCCHCQVF